MGKVIYLDDFLGVTCMEKGILDANDIANFFLSIESMTNKKLQKLCYYAQAWHYAFYKQGLFRQDIEAWVHGPVIPEVYRVYRDHGWNNIPVRQHNINNEDLKAYLSMIYNTYGSFSGDELEGFTHQESPWLEARKGLEEWEPSHNIIDPCIMEKFYWSKYESSQL